MRYFEKDCLLRSSFTSLIIRVYKISFVEVSTKDDTFFSERS